MTTRPFASALPLVLFLVACGSDPARTPEGEDPEGPGESPTDVHGNFAPPPPAEGYTRLTAPVIEGIEPGADRQFCQYVYAPLDHDMDILDVQGFQSRSSHHAVAYAVTDFKALGTSGP